MSERVIYMERQSAAWWYYLLAASPLLVIMILWPLSMQDIERSYMEGVEPEMSFNELAWLCVSLFGTSLFLALLFRLMKLTLSISGDQLLMSYPPLRFKALRISRHSITSWEIREYNPLTEYGGHGYRKRKSFRKNDLSYTIKGKVGLQLSLTDGSKILIGTQQKAKLERVMRKWMEGN